MATTPSLFPDLTREIFFDIETLAIEGDDAVELAKFGNERLGIGFKPAPESILRVPGYGNGKAEARDA